MITREELQRKAEAIKSLADGKRVWAELAGEYLRAAEVNAEGVKELESLPRDRIDPVAMECVSELVTFLKLQGDLLRRSSEECADMAALFVKFHAEGDAFDWDSPKGKEYDRQEAELTARMKQTVANEGSAEKRQLVELSTKAKAAATTLMKKYGRQFPDLLGK